MVEAHPEVSLAHLAGAPMARPKRTEAGRGERLAVLRAEFADLDPHLAGAGTDDVLDAYAVLWTARRLARGRHLTLGDGARDERRLRMEIVV